MTQIDTQTAEAALAVANTPLFLLRKLRADPIVASLARDRNAEELLSSLREISQKEPQTLQDLVLAYVYLVSLSLKENLSNLHAAAAIPIQAEWYRYIANYLAQSAEPTVRVNLTFPQHWSANNVSIKSSSNTQLIKLG